MSKRLYVPVHTLSKMPVAGHLPEEMSAEQVEFMNRGLTTAVYVPAEEAPTGLEAVAGLCPWRRDPEAIQMAIVE